MRIAMDWGLVARTHTAPLMATGTGKRWSGNKWLAVACALLGLSLLSTLAAMTVWLDFNADDYAKTDYKAVLAQRQLALVGALLAPALSTAGSVRAMFLMPRDPYRIIASSLVLLLA